MTGHLARFRVLWLVLCFSIVAAGLAAASSALAAPVTARLAAVKGTEVRAAQVDIVRSLIESDLIEHSDVLLLADDDPAFAEVEITASLTQLGESYLVILSAQFESGEQRSRKHKVESFDEIDTATARLVAALIEDVELFATAERGAVFEDEQQPEAVVESAVRAELGFGPAWPISNALRNNETMYGFHGAVVWDVRDFLVDLRTDFHFGNDEVETFAFTATIGGRYVWYDARRFGVYSGLDVGYGYVVVDDPGDNPDRGAFLVGANTGVLLLRHSDVNLDLRLRLAILTETLQGRLPVLLGVSLGVQF